MKHHCLACKNLMDSIDSSHSTGVVNSCCIQYVNCVRFGFEITFISYSSFVKKSDVVLYLHVVGYCSQFLKVYSVRSHIEIYVFAPVNY